MLQLLFGMYVAPFLKSVSRSCSPKHLSRKVGSSACLDSFYEAYFLEA